MPVLLLTSLKEKKSGRATVTQAKGEKKSILLSTDSIVNINDYYFKYYEQFLSRIVQRGQQSLKFPSNFVILAIPAFICNGSVVFKARRDTCINI